MTRETQNAGLELSVITSTIAQNRIGGIRQLVSEGQFQHAQLERSKLYLETLYSIANAPAMADKTEMRKLAAIALAAFEIRIPTGEG